MHYRCDQCDEPATCHQVEVVGGVKTIRHLCDRHAAEAGLGGAAGVPVELLALLGQAVAEALPKAAQKAAQLASGAKPQAGPELSCPGCGLTLRDFQSTHLLGCPECYLSFEAMLSGLLERQHGATHHVGKVPASAAQGKAHQQAMLVRMRRKLEQAVAAEDYRLAARLRDEIRQMEAAPPSAAPPAGAGGEQAQAEDAS